MTFLLTSVSAVRKTPTPIRLRCVPLDVCCWDHFCCQQSPLGCPGSRLVVLGFPQSTASHIPDSARTYWRKPAGKRGRWQSIVSALPEIASPQMCQVCQPFFFFIHFKYYKKGKMGTQNRKKNIKMRNHCTFVVGLCSCTSHSMRRTKHELLHLLRKSVSEMNHLNVGTSFWNFKSVPLILMNFLTIFDLQMIFFSVSSY